MEKLKKELKERLIVLNDQKQLIVDNCNKGSENHIVGRIREVERILKSIEN